MRNLLFRLLTVGLLAAVFVPAAFAQSENPLAGTYWQLENTDSAIKITLGFESDDLATGSGGCNTFGGPYSVEGDTISFGPLASTLMLCEGTGDQEATYLEALRSATRYEVTDDQLIIWHGDDQQLTFIPDPAGALLGTQWQLVSYAGTPVVVGSTVTLEFRADNQVVGQGGCNGFGGMYQIASDGEIAFSQLVSTLMACMDEAVTLQEQEYFSALQDATGFTLDGDQLTIDYGDDQQLIFALINRDVLAATQWQLVSYGETPVVAGSLVTLEFVDDSQVAGSGGCNRFSGTYTLSGDSISFSPLISTRMACNSQEMGRQETRFFDALGSAIRYEMTDGQLIIWFAGGQLTFTPMPETA